MCYRTDTEWEPMTVDGLGVPTIKLKWTYGLFDSSYVKHCYVQLFNLQQASLHQLSYYFLVKDGEKEMTHADDHLMFTCSTPMGGSWHLIGLCLRSPFAAQRRLHLLTCMMHS